MGHHSVSLYRAKMHRFLIISYLMSYYTVKYVCRPSSSRVSEGCSIHENEARGLSGAENDRNGLFGVSLADGFGGHENEAWGCQGLKMIEMGCLRLL